MRNKTKKIISIIIAAVIVCAIPMVTLINDDMAPSEKGRGFSFSDLFPDLDDEVDESGYIDSVGDLSMMVGDSKNLNASVQSNEAVGTTYILYESTDPNVATVDSNGFVIAVSEGVANIVMTEPSLGYSKTITVTVSTALAEPIVAFVLQEHELDIPVGTTYTLSGDVSLYDLNITWSSSDSSIAAVDSLGNVTALSAGTAIITAISDSGCSDSCTIYAKIPPTGVYMSDSIVEMSVGDTYQLSAVAQPEGLVDRPIIRWSSNDESIVSIDRSGLVSANSEGSTYIIAKTYNDIETSCLINVSGSSSIPTNQSFSLQEHELNIPVGSTYTLSGDVNLYDLNMTWISSNTSIANVDSFGNVTGISAGTAVITGTSEAGYSDSCTVYIKTPPTSIEISNSSISMEVGATSQLSAVAQPEGLVDRPIIRWSSNNESVATVDRNGNVTAVSEGSTYVIAKTYNDIETSCLVTVTDSNKTPVYQPFTFQDHELNLPVGTTYTLTADISLYELNMKWISSDTSLATVDSNGNVTGISAGTVVVTGTSEAGCSDSCTINVKTPPTGITISNSTLSIKTGSSVQLSAIAQPEGLVDRPIIRWSSSNESVATVDRNGNVTAISAGKTNIVARTYNNMEISCSVTVTDIPKVEGIDIGTPIIKLETGQTFDIVFTVQPTEAAENAKISFKSKDTSVATISTSGKITAVGAGSTTIVVSAENGIMSTASVQVTKSETQAIKDVKDIHIISTSNAVRKGTSLALSCVISPSDISQDYVTWSSSNENILTVDSSGKVKGISLGEATVTATIGNCSHSKTIRVIGSRDPHVYTSTPYLVIEDEKNTSCVFKTSYYDGGLYPTFSTPGIAKYAIDSVCAYEPGATEMTVKLSSGSSATVYIVVTPIYDIRVLAIGNNSNSATLKVGETFDLRPSYTPASAINNKIQFESSSPNIATVSNTGIVSAISAGTATITATAPSGVTDEFTVVVISEDTWHLPINNNEKNTFDLTVGDTKPFKLMSLPDGVTIDFLFVANENIAEISGNTLIGKSIGGTKIYAYLSDDSRYNVEVRVLPTEEYKQRVIAEARQKVLDDINAERIAAGLKPLVLDETLCKLADIRAAELREMQKIVHSRPDGSSWSTIFTEYGVRGNYSSIGENVIGKNIMVHKLVPLWMSSTAHKNAILSDKYDVTGIGICFGDEYYTGAYSACELFAKSK